MPAKKRQACPWLAAQSDDLALTGRKPPGDTPRCAVGPCRGASYGIEVIGLR